MKTKKTILKKACGKGGCGKGGLLKDTVKEIPSTLKEMGKNFKKAVNPGNISIGKGVGSVVRSLMPAPKQGILKDAIKKAQPMPVVKPTPGKYKPMPAPKPVPLPNKYNPMPSKPKTVPTPPIKRNPMPWTPQKGIPDQSKLKNYGVGWGGEKPTKK